MAEELFHRLWAGQQWPMTDDDHEFLVPAIQRIGRVLLPDVWEDKLPSINLWPAKPAKVEDASQEERQLAHIFMLVHFRDRYQEDLEPGPAVPQSQFRTLGDLGGNSSAFLGVGLGEQKRAPGYWFSSYDWDAFLAKLHADNEHRKAEIAIVNQVARWLFNQIVRGAITPQAQDRKGGELIPTATGDWRMPSAELLRQRVQNCAMVPGRPNIPNGTHWIFINKAELDAALSAVLPTSTIVLPESPSLERDEERPVKRQEMTAAQVKTATAFVRDALTANKDEGRDKLLAKARASLEFDISSYEWKRSIWPDGREAASLPRKKRAGRPSEAGSKSVEKSSD